MNQKIKMICDLKQQTINNEFTKEHLDIDNIEELTKTMLDAYIGYNRL
ncbi:hypothetical protein [Rummeliibacillus suwonensis]|nr:hypothetical protein [Rummeliibacillus suwonensis]MBO2535612.1 hypothetical protein [Rummeliibacillus suwonensis]